MLRMQSCAIAGLALVLASCAGVPPAKSRVPTPSVEFKDPEIAVNYHVFLGELALRRGMHRTAAREYMQASTYSSDTGLIRMAAYLAYEAGMNEPALALTKRWLRLDPHNREARQFQVLVYTRLGRVQPAVSAIEQLYLPGKVKSSNGYAALAEMLTEEAGAAKALPVFQQLGIHHPEDAQIQYGIAMMALNLGKVTTAEKAIGQSLKLHPGWQPAQLLSSRISIMSGHASEGLALAKGMLAAQPQNISLRLSYAALLLQAGRLADAKTAFAAALKLQPANPRALYALGLLELQSSNLDAARNRFTQLMATGSYRDEAGYFLGVIAESGKQDREALQWYENVTAGPELRKAHIGVARILERSKGVRPALDWLDRISVKFPDEITDLTLMASDMLIKHGDKPAAMKRYDTVLENNPDNSDVRYARALLAEDMGKISMAEQDLKRILAKHPDNPAALNALGYTLTEHSKRYGEAQEFIARALKLQPDNPAIIDSMGWVEYRLGHLSTALRYLHQAYAKMRDPEVAAHLAEVLWVSGDKSSARKVLDGALREHPGSGALEETRRRFGE